jgi:hypothetical protein
MSTLKENSSYIHQGTYYIIDAHRDFSRGGIMLRFEDNFIILQKKNLFYQFFNYKNIFEKPGGGKCPSLPFPRAPKIYMDILLP